MLGFVMWAGIARPHEAGEEQRLPTIGPAADFSLPAADGSRLAMRDLRGKAVAVAFIYTTCPDVCPLLTDKMVEVKDGLGADFAARVAFVTVTVDPERDTAEALRDYAEAFGADVPGWWFLTGTPDEVREVALDYGVAVRIDDGAVEHTLLTTLVDRQGRMRVQYLGYRFDPEEFRHDLLDLLKEP
jgi:protein SCO1/2